MSKEQDQKASIKNQEETDDDVDDQRSTTHAGRPKWNNQLEFLMSCIATSVGLGNVWRFPFVAYQNGGGAFLIPYLIVLVLIGMPMYYLETVLGQFSSSNNVKIWACCPAMRGSGYAQALGATYVLTYYVAIIAICLFYFVISFISPLPWSQCEPTWEFCVNAGTMIPKSNGTNFKSSAELYFVKKVLQRSDGIDNGIGLPLPALTGALFVSWLTIFVIVSAGVKSSGRASYFLALFPYVILIILFIRSWFLAGAGRGIEFFFTPTWQKILELKVWYAAVTQVFFSLSVCSGALIMFSSYNMFTQNVYKVSIVVSVLDTLTSLLSGMTIFAILGNLAHELGYDNIEDVVGSGGASLAFVSYPDAISKTVSGEASFANHFLAVMFFLMMTVLGVGSGVALLSTVSTLLMDNFPRVKTIYVAAFACSVGFLIGLVYVTPGGQYVLELVDYYGGTFLRLFAAICETIGIFWIYGLENLCTDVRFMLSKKPSPYWRICWAVLTPVIMITVFIYGVVSTSALKYGKTYVYPKAAYFAGNMLQYTGMMLVPLCIGAAFVKYRAAGTCKEVTKKAFSKTPKYGPAEFALRKEWKWYHEQVKALRPAPPANKVARVFAHIGRSLVGLYDVPKYETLRSQPPQAQPGQSRSQ